MARLILLDLFCKAGGCSRGYSDAGFDVVGVDIEPQKNYPYRFVQGDALEFVEDYGHEFDAIHASPPCQAYTCLKHLSSKKHPDLLAPTREKLEATGKPYVIENVPGAPIRASLMLCGTMFGLRTTCGAELRRHRYFETNWFSGFVPECQHGVGAKVATVTGHTCEVSKTAPGSFSNRVISVHGDKARDCGLGTISVVGEHPQVVHNQVRETFPVSEARIAMGIDWMTLAELCQAIPPAYTHWVGIRLMEELRRLAA